MPTSAETRNRVERVRNDLRDEFPGVSPDRFDGHVEAVVSGLLAQARFADFVPLLVRRKVRERLAAETVAAGD